MDIFEILKYLLISKAYTEHSFLFKPNIIFVILTEYYFNVWYFDFKAFLYEWRTQKRYHILYSFVFAIIING